MIGRKERLLEAIAGKNRGILADEMDRQAILAATVSLEECNPTPNPLAAASLLEGDWRLLYTTSTELLGIDRIPVFQLGQIYQCIRTAESKIYNIAEVVGVPLLEGIISVTAKFTAVNSKRVDVRFNRGIWGLQRILGYQSPPQFIDQINAGQKFLPIDFKINEENQKGWLEITYLDENLRIGRGNQGSLFILSKN